MAAEVQKRAASPEYEFPYPKRPHHTSIDNLPEESSLPSCSDIEFSDIGVEVMPGLLCSYRYHDDFMLEELVDTPSMEIVTGDMLNYKEIIPVLEDLLQSLDIRSTDNFTKKSLNHFNKVENLWRNMSFIDVLIKGRCIPCSVARCSLAATQKLSGFLMSMIRRDPSFGTLFDYSDNATMMRNALSILIGYWSNEDMIAPLFFTLGGRALGLKCVSEDSSFGVVKGDNTLPWREDINEKKMRRESPTFFEGILDCSPIQDLCQDACIMELVDQLLNIEEAVMSCEEVLKSLQSDVPAGIDPVYHNHERHMRAALRFWYNPQFIVPLIKAFKQSTSLVNVLKKYARKAQLVRCVERMNQIQQDPMLFSILQSDDVEKRVSGALSVLFGYWSDTDMIWLLHNLRVALYSNRTLRKVDLAKCEDIQAFEYLANGPDDIEGLENVLADKYFKHSKEYMDLLNKHQAPFSSCSTAPMETIEPPPEFDAADNNTPPDPTASHSASKSSSEHMDINDSTTEPMETNDLAVGPAPEPHIPLELQLLIHSKIEEPKAFLKLAIRSDQTSARAIAAARGAGLVPKKSCEPQ